MNSTNADNLTARPSILLDDFKQRARDQWGANPCGAHVAGELPFGSREYFDAIEVHRYVTEAPWMKQAIGFDCYAGKRVLEIGFGTGTDLLQFARGGAIVTVSLRLATRRTSAFRKLPSMWSTPLEFCTTRLIRSSLSARFIGSSGPEELRS